MPISMLAPSLVVALALLAVGQSAAVNLFVSPDGDDGWSGTLARPNADRTNGPVATLHRARDAVRQVRAADPGKPVTVTVRKGVYYLPEPLVLGPEDSGTPQTPVRWQAFEGEEVVLSGGKPITGPWSSQDGRTYSTTLPQVAAGRWYFRLLRVGDEWAIRARYPNYDPEAPYTGGWLFAKPCTQSPGTFGAAVGSIHNRGDMMKWRVDVPQEGDYNLFHYYAAQNAPWGNTDMGGRCTFTVDDEEPVVLENLQDTGSFRTFKWSDRNAVLHLSQGPHTIRWTNTHGGGVNYDAFVLCDDPDWRPRGTPPEPPPDRHMLLIHAETFVESRGKELTTSMPASRRYFGFSQGELRDWPTSKSIEMHLFPAWGWVSSIEPIAEIDLERGVATLAGREASQEIRVGNRYYLENIAEELDMPGEWYLDEETGTLRYRPAQADFRDRQIVAPVLDRIIHIKGDVAKAAATGHIHFVGFTFKDTSYTPRIDSPYYPPDAAIWIQNAHGCLIEDCRFTRLGGSAVNLVGDAQHTGFLGNTVQHVGQNGVFMVGEAGDNPFPKHNTVAGCTMRHIGLIHKHVAGVYIGRRDPALAQEPGNLIAHNLITDCPRYAIGIKMNQGNTVVEYNEIRRTNLETNDTGGIESCVRNAQAPGNTYRYNFVADAIGLKTTPTGEILRPYYTWGIYMDDHSSHATIYGNICVRNFRGGVHVHGGQKNVIENNILVDSQEQQVEFNNIGDAMVGNVFRRNIVYRTQPGGNMIRSNGWNDRVLARCDGNLYWNTADETAVSFLGRTVEQWREMGYDKGSRVADPLFVDPAGDDYTLRPDSPALEMGFEPIPVERIGLKGYRADEYR